jgi:hypothetical protein
MLNVEALLLPGHLFPPLSQRPHPRWAADGAGPGQRAASTLGLTPIGHRPQVSHPRQILQHLLQQLFTHV